MDLTQRIELYGAIEEYRKRPLIVYCTSTRAGVQAMMAGDAVREFIDQIDAITDTSAIDVLLHSTGGDGLAAWKIMSLLREKFSSVAVLVPYMAFSAATLFALGADEIVMHPHASLGPIDPQITITLPDGKQRGFSFEDVGAFLRFLAEEVGITEQSYASSVMEKLFSVVDPVHLGGAKRASELSTDVGERLLQMHMKGEKGRTSARAIAEDLNKSFFAHSDAVSRSRARALKLKIAKDDLNLERLIWNAYLGLESYMQLRTPFNPIHHFLANGGEAALTPKAPINLPPDVPVQLAQQVWTQIAQAALASSQTPGFEVEYSLVNAVVESVRVASENCTIGKLTATRLPGGEIKMAAIDKEAKWRQMMVPNNTPAELKQST